MPQEEHVKCPHCGNDRPDLLEKLHGDGYICTVCSKYFMIKKGK